MAFPLRERRRTAVFAGYTASPLQLNAWKRLVSALLLLAFFLPSITLYSRILKPLLASANVGYGLPGSYMITRRTPTTKILLFSCSDTLVSGRFAPWSFRSQSFRPNQKSLRSILKVTSPHTEVTLSYIFISFCSVLSERDNLFVSTWSQMQMITKLDVTESSLFVSESTQKRLAIVSVR